MTKLFVIGDSFSYPHKTKIKLWPHLVADYLGSRLGKSVDVVNTSMIGCSQDFIWKQFNDIENSISSEDFLVMILTSCDRFWVIEQRPEWSNLRSIENIEQVTNDIEFQKIILGFMTRIWRDSLARQHQDQRLGYLSYRVMKKKLRKPLAIKAFHSVIDNENQFDDIIFSKDSLGKIQLLEWEKFQGCEAPIDPLLDRPYWNHVDCRYNHLTLSNHAVLGKIVGDSLLSENSPDLSSPDFHKKIITIENHKDKTFAEKELNLLWFNEMINNSLRSKLGARLLGLKF